MPFTNLSLNQIPSCFRIGQYCITVSGFQISTHLLYFVVVLVYCRPTVWFHALAS